MVEVLFVFEGGGEAGGERVTDRETTLISVNSS